MNIRLPHLYAASSLVLCVAVQAAAFSLEGVVQEIIPLGEEDPLTREGAFSVSADARGWHIRYAVEGSNMAYWESTKDADSGLILTFGGINFGVMGESMSKLPGVLPSARIPEDPAFRGVGFVETGSVPRASGTTPAIGILYYAYCSSSYLDLHASDPAELDAPFVVDGQLTYHEYGIKSVRVGRLRRHELAPYLPEEIQFLHDGRHWGLSGPRQLPRPFGSGFTNALFVAEGWTNVGGVALPTSVRFDVFRPVLGQARVELARRVSIQLVSIRPLAEAVAIPRQLPVQTEISDRRFMNPSAALMDITYTTNRWLRDDEVRSLPAYADALARQSWARSQGMPTNVGLGGISPPRAATRSSIILTIGMVGVILMLPVVLYWTKRKRNIVSDINPGDGTP